ncbi:LpqB family beta-propeller domain-containing protein [Aeromicrobium yanjiei]|uniref:LpqB family beta-propeller domain-containing protein n=1 Tax=Aeromicrobium yanjiei TaxID=2662028 RepID=UPI00188EEA44|nr:LpqB family beta-propeller domain-containing protein [Aeromicrobium yanjiei]
MITRRRSPWVALLTVLALAVSACAGIPNGGPVTRVEDDTGLGESTVRYLPAKPVQDAPPEQIVRGYLDAMLAFPASPRTAAAFLTPDAARKWDPAARVEVYSKPAVSGRVPTTMGLEDPRGVSTGAVDVRLAFSDEAVLDRQGHYTPRSGRGSVTYTLEEVDGQWRISNPQPGALVNSKFFSDYFRPFNLFFFDRPGRRLVADPVHLVVGDQLATNLMTSLARGPGRAIAQATRTYLPPLPDLRPSVPLTDEGVADVELTDDLGELSDSARDHLSAQVVWTLRQVPDITAVQIIGGSTPLTAGGREVQPMSAWGGYGPSLARGHGYALSGDRVVEIDDGSVSRLSGAWGRDALGSELIGVSAAGVAGVLAGRDRVRVTNRKGTGAREIDGNGFLAPRWDDDGLLWLVDAAAAGARVRVVDGDRPRRIDARALRGLDVTSFYLSPDGTRYAVTTRAGRGDRVLVGMVLRDAKDRLLGLGTARRLAISARNVRSASWASTTTIGFLADTATGVGVDEVGIDGADTPEALDRGAGTLPATGVNALAIGPGDVPRLYVTDTRGRLWYRSSDGSWRAMKAQGVTGLTFGR